MDLSPVWLGVWEMNVLREFIADIVWGEVDFLLADLPPGAAADKPPVIAGFIPDLDGAIVVTTPSEVASDVVQKSIAYARDLGIKVLGIVENMSTYRCPQCGNESELFEGDTEAMCQALDLPLLGRIPFDRTLAKSFDKGTPLLDASYPTLKRYDEIASRIKALLDYKKILPSNYKEPLHEVRLHEVRNLHELRESREDRGGLARGVLRLPVLRGALHNGHESR